MKDSVRMVLADRYAQAFLNVQKGLLSHEVVESIDHLRVFLMNNEPLLKLLNFDVFSRQKRQELLATVFHNFHLSSYFAPLTDLLLNKHRLDLLPDILEKIVDESFQRAGVHKVYITSSHVLRSDQLEALRLYMERACGGKVVYQHRIDPSLIAGIRMQSATHIWEHSIKKQLQEVLSSLTH